MRICSKKRGPVFIASALLVTLARSCTRVFHDFKSSFEIVLKTRQGGRQRFWAHSLHAPASFLLRPCQMRALTARTGRLQAPGGRGAGLVG